ncbi:hypothetical protein PV327_008762 [Microctonus hyperodae]|uniref:Uncharacterized protein n=1 Tax=Microctonus hyperodae TaxID=165561 RepID=A0AA39FT11_MICHY|nr:hypothetical protein PV327_008762 [Microctonus hyperodae]
MKNHHAAAEDNISQVKWLRIEQSLSTIVEEIVFELDMYCRKMLGTRVVAIVKNNVVVIKNGRHKHGKPVIDIKQPVTRKLQSLAKKLERTSDDIIDRAPIDVSHQKYSDKRLDKINSKKPITVELVVGSEVYYPNKKLSSKRDGYSAKLAHRYLGPAIVSKILSPMVVELSNKNGQKIGKFYAADLKIPRRSL